MSLCIQLTLVLLHSNIHRDRLGANALTFSGEGRAVGAGSAIGGSGDATGRVFFHAGNPKRWREHYADLHEKSGLPPLEAGGRTRS